MDPGWHRSIPIGFIVQRGTLRPLVDLQLVCAGIEQWHADHAVVMQPAGSRVALELQSEPASAAMHAQSLGVIMKFAKNPARSACLVYRRDRPYLDMGPEDWRQGRSHGGRHLCRNPADVLVRISCYSGPGFIGLLALGLHLNSWELPLDCFERGPGQRHVDPPQCKLEGRKCSVGFIASDIAHSYFTCHFVLHWY